MLKNSWLAEFSLAIFVIFKFTIIINLSLFDERELIIQPNRYFGWLYCMDDLDSSLFSTYCKDENLDHKVGIYCNMIGPLDQS